MSFEKRTCPVCKTLFIPIKVNQVVCSAKSKCHHRYKNLRREGRLEVLTRQPRGEFSWSDMLTGFLMKHPTARRDFHELETMLP